MTDDEIKVTDKRMFTSDGELKDEFQHLEESASEAQPAGDASAQPASEVVAENEPATDDEVQAATAQPADPPAKEPEGGPVEMPFGGEDPDELSFFDLVGMVAQPIAIYLGDAKLPGGESAENLDMARLHIDLLEILKNKTAGNLTAQEQSFLEDLLYQLRLRYVQKRG
ncbi:MAG: DUF1844 domain-containing protein [Thermoanaerobaculia bacterium]